jgi:hypothetical protein
VWCFLEFFRELRNQAFQIKLCNKFFALYQGTTLVVPPPAENGQGFSPCHRKICTKLQCKRAQGLKPRPFLRLYGTTKVVP